MVILRFTQLLAFSILTVSPAMTYAENSADAGSDPTKQRSKCAHCSGSGYLMDKETCSKCGGKGTIYTPPKKLLSGYSVGRTSKCSACSGKGSKSQRKRCQECLGKGFLEKVVAPTQQVAEQKAVAPTRPKQNDARKTNDSGKKDVGNNQDFMSIIQQGLSVNQSGKDEYFIRYAFDFAIYRQWEDLQTTKVQKNDIITDLCRKGCNSKLYKDYVRCCFALIPDGLSFAVEDVTEGSVDGQHVYYVSLALLRYEGSIPGNRESKWCEQPWQNYDLGRYLWKQWLIGDSMTLVILNDGDDSEEIRKWNKGKIIVSRGWFFDILIINAIETGRDGSRRPYQAIEKGEYVFRSINERRSIDARLDIND